MLTKVGADPFGDYIVGALDTTFGVDTRFVGRHPGLLTPLAFAELADPGEPTIIFYRAPQAPDMTIEASDVGAGIVEAVPILWVAGSCVSAEPSRSTIHALLDRRERRPHTVLDLDWRPHFWADPVDAGREIGRLLDGVTLAIGNRTECEVAVGTPDPHRAADRLLDRGLEAAIVKMGADGVLVATAAGVREEIPPYPGRGRVRARRRRRLRRRALPRPAVGLGSRPRAPRYGNAAGAIVACRLMCADDMPYLDEIEALLKDRPCR